MRHTCMNVEMYCQIVSELRRSECCVEEYRWFETIGSLEASVVRQPQTVFTPLPPTSFYGTAWKPSTWTPWPHECTVRGRLSTATPEAKPRSATPFCSAWRPASSTQFDAP